MNEKRQLQQLQNEFIDILVNRGIGPLQAFGRVKHWTNKARMKYQSDIPFIQFTRAYFQNRLSNV